MTTFTLKVDVENAAFDPDPRPELARILRETAERLEGDRADDAGWYQTVLDANGNDVGRFAIKHADGSPWRPADDLPACPSCGSTEADCEEGCEAVPAPVFAIDSDDRDYSDADRDAGRYPDSAGRDA